MSEAQKDLSELVREWSAIHAEAWMKKRQEEFKSEIDILPLRIEALCLGIQDTKLRSLIEELGRLENFLDSFSGKSGSVLVLKPFVQDMQSSQVQKIRDYLSKYDKHDYKTQKILDYLLERHPTVE